MLKEKAATQASLVVLLHYGGRRPGIDFLADLELCVGEPPGVLELRAEAGLVLAELRRGALRLEKTLSVK